MNTFQYGELLPPLCLGVANLFFAGVLHRAIVRSSVLLSRRHFFEFLAVLAFVVALILMLAGFALWRENPRFVLVCSAGWMLACSVAAGVLRYRNGRRADEVLTLPDAWPSSVLPSRDTRPRLPDHRDVAVRDTGTASRGVPVPLDAVTRARLKKARREGLDSNTRFRMNRTVNASGPAKRHDPRQRGRD